MTDKDEYLRRNLFHAKSVGVHADIGMVIDRLTNQRRPPKWLIKLLVRAHQKASDVSKEMWRHRDEVKP